jgi:hypothetical protein
METFKQSRSNSAIKNNCCFLCKKKTIFQYECKCGQRFCIHHKNAENHNCKFDYKNYHKQELLKNNPIIIAEKIKKIQ